MAACVFCRIIAREIPSSIASETDDILIVKDIAPKAPIHFLIIPKKHSISIADLKDSDVEIAGKMLLAARDIASQNNISSFRLIANTGSQSGQSVFHTHFHFLAGTQMTDF